LAKQPKRSWIIPALTLLTSIALAAVMLELILSPGTASALGYRGELRSRLLADYAEDPIAARIHELRLTIVEDVLGMNDGDGSDSSVIALLMQDPVPTATPKAAKHHTNTPVPSSTQAASDEPTAAATATPLPGTSNTPPPPTAMAIGGVCDRLSITSMWVESRDEIRARVRNNSSMDARIVDTVFEWPDVPDPTYVDWFKFDGDRYHDDLDDHQSPTLSSKQSRRVKDGDTETWAVDFDDKPDYGIYGSFSLTLTLDVSGHGTCTVSASTFREFPAPTPEPTDTPEPAPIDTAVPTDTPLPSATPSDTPVPIDTLTPTDAPTPVDTPIPEPTTPAPET
jgi:hypothetical protein